LVGTRGLVEQLVRFSIVISPIVLRYVVSVQGKALSKKAMIAVREKRVYKTNMAAMDEGATE